MRTVDLNCDMGESFGPWVMGNDAELMKYISSANIACGFHAGDPTTMRRTVELALENDVAVGAHPGYRDLQGFGRRNISMPPGEVRDLVLYQVAALKGVCEAAGTVLRHVKPHGALYNQAASDPEIAAAVASAVAEIDGGLTLFGLSGSLLISAARDRGLKTASEVFADRTYQGDGTLTPRSAPLALIKDAADGVRQAVQMIEQGIVTAVDGSEVSIQADTVCLHGDGEHAAEFVRAIRTEFDARGIRVAPPS